MHVRQRPVQMDGGLGVHDQALASRLDPPFGEQIRCLHHEMGLERQGRVRPAGGDDVGPEGEIGDELAVHHVPLDQVDAGLLEGLAFLAESSEVRGEDRRRDANRASVHLVRR